MRFPGDAGRARRQHQTGKRACGLFARLGVDHEIHFVTALGAASDQAFFRADHDRPVSGAFRGAGDVSQVTRVKSVNSENRDVAGGAKVIEIDSVLTCIGFGKSHMSSCRCQRR